MRVLLDSNIFISYLLYPRRAGPIRQIIQAFFSNRFTLIIPEALLDEFVNKIPHKPYLSERIRQDELEVFVELLKAFAEFLPKIEEEIPAVTRDSNDDYLLAYAVVGQADYLVTGDEDLLVIKRVGNLKIIQPAEFANILNQME